MKYTGSCHCQNVRYEVEMDLKEAMECNCSICVRRGHLLAFVPETSFKLLTDSKALTDYQWKGKVVHFLFCSKCGCASFGWGVMEGAKMMAVNVRCLEGVNPHSIKINQFDGKSLV